MTKEELVELVNREDFLEYMQSLSKEEVETLLGSNFSRMVGFDQNNVHHCYDLYNHIIHTVDGVDNVGLSPEEYTNLRIAALFHDIGKPDVVMEKNGKNVFYGHAKKSEEIARSELANVGLSPDEIDKITFYISHHDDFISYKKDLPSYLSTHMYIRQINPDTVAEKLVENEYNFERMGLDSSKIRYACKYLVQNRDEDKPKEEVVFSSPNGTIDIDISMEDVLYNMTLDEFQNGYHASKRDYELLINLCEADAKAQTKYYAERGKVLCSRKDKLDNMNSVRNSLDKAYNELEEIKQSVELNRMVINEVSLNQEKSNNLKDAKELYNSFREIKEEGKEK